jgi:hypothetical protein
MTISSYSSPCDSPRCVMDKKLAWKSGMTSPKVGSKLSLNLDSPVRMTLKMRKSAAASKQRYASMMMDETFNSASFYYDANESRCTSLGKQNSKNRPPLSPSATVSESTSIEEDRRSKKNVSFSTMATVHTMPVQTHDDKTKSWYSKKDYSIFECDRQNTVRLVQSANRGEVELLENDGAICMLGLERTLTRRQALHRKYLAMRHSYSLLDRQHQQQKLQRNVGINSSPYAEKRLVTMSATTPQALAAIESQRYHFESLLLHHSTPPVNSLSGLKITKMLDEALSLYPRTFSSVGR